MSHSATATAVAVASATRRRSCRRRRRRRPVCYINSRTDCTWSLRLRWPAARGVCRRRAVVADSRGWMCVRADRVAVVVAAVVAVAGAGAGRGLADVDPGGLRQLWSCRRRRAVGPRDNGRPSGPL